MFTQSLVVLLEMKDHDFFTDNNITYICQSKTTTTKTPVHARYINNCASKLVLSCSVFLVPAFLYNLHTYRYTKNKVFHKGFL